MELVTLAFGKIKFNYTPQDNAGEPVEKEAEYDFQAQLIGVALF